MNPIMEQLNQQQNGIFNIINQISNAQNPAQAFYSLSQTNPQVKSVVNFIAPYGNNYKAAFMAKAQEMGVDPNTIFNQIPNGVC